MNTRREFLLMAGAAAMTSGIAMGAQGTRKRFEVAGKFGMGGVAVGNGFRVSPDSEATGAMEASWENGVRFFDTSPWYGLGLSERRMGHFLDDKKREDFVLATKIGRLMTPDAEFRHGMWKGTPGFNYRYDYTAEGTRRSIEDSLLRLGLPSIDVVFIHDLSPDNGDMKEKWTEYFAVAEKGAMKELAKMKEEGLIKAWGMGVNRPDPIMKCLEVAEPDVFLAATQYSLIDHEQALNGIFPACEKRGVSLVMGAPLNSGFLAGVDRYNYRTEIPKEHFEKREKLSKIAAAHGTDLRTAALQFTAAPAVVAATIPGARDAKQAEQNAASMKAKIPADFWKELKAEKLIAENAPVPA